MRNGYAWVFPKREHPPRAELVRGRAILAGDAAGFADPVTAEGISNALISGRLAAAAVMEGDCDAPAVRSAYARRLGDAITDDLRLARLVARSPIAVAPAATS